MTCRQFFSNAFITVLLEASSKLWKGEDKGDGMNNAGGPQVVV